ncbi:MAG: class I tRNA ligase family protein [Pirellulales bacterium]|nr:class I tRNA ligase family protein [Pirellulales bacterium]
MFAAVPGQIRFPELEERIGEFWKSNQIYQQSLANRAGAPRFVFFEGPPTANGMPHPGHCLTRAIKDLYPRYKTMRGFLCERKAGWDTHGLPVEVEVCKELGIHSKEEIEAFGIEPFIHKCQASVWRYMQQWERLTERLGFWVDLRQAYVTYHQTFVESVWWSLKQLFERGLLYQGHKIVWWWAQGGTALSSGEVGQGYRQVADPSVYVKFPIVMDDRARELGIPEGTSLLVWTTTPWTLPSNQFAAVNPELEYVVVVDSRQPGQPLLVAESLREALADKFKSEFQITSRYSGTQLVGLCYLPPFDIYINRNDSRESNSADNYSRKTLAWKLVAADFVTTDSGSGAVHIAPAFGEVDFQVLLEEQSRAKNGSGPQLINCVGPDGKFTAEGPDYCRGRWVKDCDRDIIRDLKSRGLLVHQEQYLHDYPFCWRAENDPLIQYPRRSWFIRTSQFKDQMLANNAQINWLPEHIRDGRFGNFLATNVDWALSRERYWGTPLPIWVCDATGQMEAVCNYAELLSKPGVTGTEVWEQAVAAARAAGQELVEDLKVHKPYIDAITYDSPFATGPDGLPARMRRVPDVIDCWYDSGAMPFAQWGYQGEAGGTSGGEGAAAAAREKFHQQFPADFISEAIDQTRGWFYSQLAISTLLFGEKPANAGQTPARQFDPQRDAPQTQYPKAPSASALATGFAPTYPHPFKNCIVLGLMLGEDGQKMSKSKRNYREPNEIFDKYGADALRWYFYATQPPWTTIRYSEQAIKESVPDFLLRLWNVYSFFVIYANIDGFDPAARLLGDVAQLEPDILRTARGYRPISQRNELDRWICSELHRTAAGVIARMDQYDNFGACGLLKEFVDALSNWYVRRSRDRFWSNDKESPEKLDAYWTLYESLLTAAKLIAPFTPFLAEELWQKLAAEPFGNRAVESVHLCDYPTGEADFIDEALSLRMNLVREIASLGRAARGSAKLKVRQPLAKVEVVLADPAQQDWLERHQGLIAEELNVLQVEFTRHAEQYIDYTVLPDLKKLGPKIGKRLPLLKQALATADAAKLLAEMQERGSVTLPLADGPLELTSDELLIRLQAKPGWTAAQGTACVVVLATELTPELLRAGYAREIVHTVQSLRKDLELEYTDRIEILTASDDGQILATLTEHGPYIQAETLATAILPRLDTTSPRRASAVETLSLGEGPIEIAIRV